MPNLFSYRWFCTTDVMFMVSVAGAAQVAEGFNKTNFHSPLEINCPYNPLIAGTTFVYDGTTDQRSTYKELLGSA
jgi:hypothetical protein